MKSNMFYWKSLVRCFMIFVICITFSSWAQMRKINYAVIGIKNAEGVSTGEADIIADRLRIELFNTGLVDMMERDQMQDIMKEQGFQKSGVCTDEACMVEIGQILGVERLVSGSIGKLGSMFLLNFRAIDVQTAKILKVVSVDISGGIEDVVQHLPSIAKQLVGSGEKKIALEKPESKPEPIEEAKPESEPEPELVVSPPVITEDKKEKEIIAEARKEKKNKNRFGIQLIANFFPGDIPMQLYNDSTDEYVDTFYQDYFDSLEQEPDYYSVFYNKLNMAFKMHFLIKAGPFLTVDVGPGFMVAKREGGYVYEMDDGAFWIYKDVEHMWNINTMSFSTGLSFVKRFYPLKINFGLICDLNFNRISYEYNYYYEDSDYFTDEMHLKPNSKSAFNGSIGGRAGVEIMGGTHFGFSIDLIYRYYKFEKEFNFFNEYTYEYYTEKWEFKMPPFGLGTGINFYF